MVKTLFFVNLNAGRLRKKWKELEAALPKWVSDYEVVITQTTTDVDKNLVRAVDEGFERIISVGAMAQTNMLSVRLCNIKRHTPTTASFSGAFQQEQGVILLVLLVFHARH